MAQQAERADGRLIENNVERHVSRKTAIATGGLTGTGFLEDSSTGGGYVPEQHTDFIFTVVGEELGFVGAGVLLGLFGVLVLARWRTAHLARDLAAR